MVEMFEFEVFYKFVIFKLLRCLEMFELFETKMLELIGSNDWFTVKSIDDAYDNDKDIRKL